MKKFLAIAAMAILASSSMLAQVVPGPASTASADLEDISGVFSATAKIIRPLELHNYTGDNFDFGTINRAALVGPYTDAITLTVLGDANDDFLFTKATSTYDGDMDWVNNPAMDPTGQDVNIEVAYGFVPSGVLSLDQNLAGGNGEKSITITGTANIVANQQRGNYAGSVEFLAAYVP